MKPRAPEQQRASSRPSAPTAIWTAKNGTSPVPARRARRAGDGEDLTGDLVGRHALVAQLDAQREHIADCALVASSPIPMRTVPSTSALP